MAKYEWSNSLFINPYNFVPVNLKKTPRSDITQQKENLFTGYFECRIKCRTPLAIPDVSRATEMEDKHFYYPFFTIDGKKPVIPGSSIRGVIRSVYETITDSCFGSMQKDTKITARTKDAFKPGLLKKQIKNGREEWILYSAQRHLLVIDSRFYNNQNLDNRINLYNANNLQRTGDEVKFRIRDNKHYVPLNIYQYVLYHEMAHMSTTELQHTPKFHELLNLISLAGFELGFIDLSRTTSEFYLTNGQPISCRMSMVDEISKGCDLLKKANPHSKLYYESIKHAIKRYL